MEQLAGITIETKISWKDILEKIYEGAYMTKKSYNNSEFDYHHCIEVLQHPENDNEILIIWGISKRFEYLSEEKQESILSSACITRDEVNTWDVFNCGLYAPIESLSIPEKDVEKALNEIASRIDVVNTLFGFYMDKPVNRIGNTDWDFLNGNIGF